MIKEALDEFATSITKTWPHDRTKTVGASEIGLCARRMHFVKKAKAHDDSHVEGWGARMRGNVMESELWVPAMEKKFGKRYLHGGALQKTFADKWLSATPDGLVVGLKRDALKHLGVKDIESDCILVECKSLDPRVNLRQAKDENTYQVQVQMGLIRKLTKHKPVYGLISYMDASFWNEVSEWPVKFDERVFKAAEARAEQILTSEGPQDLAPEGWIAGGSECEYCPFTKACGVIRRSVPEGEAAADPQFAAEITDMCLELQELEAEVEQGTARVREKQQAIKDRLREKGVRKIPKVVTWSAVKGRKSYDNKAIHAAASAAGIDIEEHTTIGEPSDQLRVMVLPR